MDILGSESVKAILEAIHDTVQKLKTTDTPVDTLPTAERERLVDRIKQRVAQRLMGLNDAQFACVSDAFIKTDSAATA